MKTNSVNGLTVQLPILGRVRKKARNGKTFVVQTRGGTKFDVVMKPESRVHSLMNLDRLNRSQTGDQSLDGVREGDLVAVQGVLYASGADALYEAMTVHVLKTSDGAAYLFERTHWWKAQIEAMCNKWLDVLFGDKRSYELDDFSALYRTTLDMEGRATADDTQEVATLSRLIYGLSSAYLLGGDERYFKAAKAGVEYQREAFRSYSADGRFCFWIHARKRDRHGIHDHFPSLADDDAGSLPLYEQIYALAGLAQYYRVTGDQETLTDIEHTLRVFETFFADKRRSKLDGFFSHIDPVTFKSESPSLDAKQNSAKKNWNSIGDHLPAYLINVILSLEPPPLTNDGVVPGQRKFFQDLLNKCVEILKVTADLIATHFPEPGNPYVNERFDRKWKPVKNWGWQKDRAVVGHNLKIAWNLTRVANYYRAQGQPGLAKPLFDRAYAIGRDMARLGIDQIRSGVYDSVERVPRQPGPPVRFAWLNTKDFWQQEQGILAYLIMYGHLRQMGRPAQADEFLELARELSAFWNLYFLDRERIGVFFRVSDNGTPVIEGTYGDKGGHSISAYHVFELAYLAHIYQLAYLKRTEPQHTTFCLHFRPAPGGLRSINVLPDFVGPDVLEIAQVDVDGVPRPDLAATGFRVPLRVDDLGKRVTVYLRQTEKAFNWGKPRDSRGKR